MLDVLKVEDDAIAFEEHLMNQVSFKADLMLLEGLLELALEFTGVKLLLISEFIINIADVYLIQ